MSSPVDLEQRVAALESRRQRNDEDLNSMTDTIIDTREDVRILRRDVNSVRLELAGLARKLVLVQNDGERLNRKVDALQRGMDAIIAHLGLTVEPDNRDD